MARLILTRKNQPQQSYFLTGEDTLIGTGPSCNIPLESTALHAEHARISRHNGSWSLTAVELTGKLKVNHGQSHEHLLKDGDIIHLDCYTLMFSDDGVTAPAESGAGLPPSGKLRVVSDRHFGRTISLDKPVTRFGRAGSMAAMISRRREGHYLAHLEGDEFPLVNHMEIGEQAYPLNDGDRITMGGLEFEFSTTPSGTGAH
ncbi:MAG: FHA domain-containing protein, partial [Gammaproteobacteria bacterium]|nr:FHA domain-containing protein [Gammaproteobacteria bacterium]